MDDAEYYAMMRRQYSNVINIAKKKNSENRANNGAKKSGAFNDSLQTPGSFSEWENKYGHEDAEMFMERNSGDDNN